MKKLILTCLFVLALSGCRFITPTTPVDTMTFQLLPGVDTVQQGDDWIDAGCQFIIGETTLDPTSVTNPVDTSTPGEYVVTYNLTYDSYDYHAERHVMVVDTIPPTIVLLPGVDTIFIGEDWNDGGALASDSDQDQLEITTTGVVDNTTLGTYTITYTATDSAGNSASIDRVVTVTTPIISDIINVEDVLALEDGVEVHVIGIVTGIVTYGFMLYDDGHYIFIYDFDHFDQIQVGAEIDIRGTRGTYNHTDQIAGITFEILSYDNTLPEPETATIYEILNDEIEYGATITITGLLEYNSTDDRYTMTDNSNNLIYIYFRSNEEALDPYVGDTITIDVILVYFEIVAYNGTTNDVIIVE